MKCSLKLIPNPLFVYRAVMISTVDVRNTTEDDGLIQLTTNLRLPPIQFKLHSVSSLCYSFTVVYSLYLGLQLKTTQAKNPFIYSFVWLVSPPEFS